MSYMKSTLQALEKAQHQPYKIPGTRSFNKCYDRLRAGNLITNFPIYNLFNDTAKVSKVYPRPNSFKSRLNQFYKFIFTQTWIQNLDSIKNYIDTRSFISVIPSFSNFDVSFSYDPWDILTMSMRGINSCMSWSNGRASHLYGSLCDPNCAIIYLSDQQSNCNSFGTKMIARAVVRIVEDLFKNKYLFLEQVYVSNISNWSFKSELFSLYSSDAVYDITKKISVKIFTEYLSQRSRLPVISSNFLKLKLIDFPERAKIHSEYLTYSDAGLNYS